MRAITTPVFMCKQICEHEGNTDARFRGETELTGDKRAGAFARSLLKVTALSLILGSCGRDYVRGGHADQQSPPPPGLFSGRTDPVTEDETFARGQRIEGGELAAPDSEPPREAELYLGTGTLIETSKGAVRLDPREGSYTLNFSGADIREVAGAVLGGMLGISHVIDPRVSGTVTARTARPLPREQLLPAFEDILAMNGAVLIADPAMYRIVPADQARSMTPIIGGLESRNRGFGVHIIPVRFTSADALQQSLEPFIVPGRGLQVDEARNLLLFRGPGVEAADLVSMVELFDVDWMAGMSFALLPLANANVGEVLVELDAIFGQGGAANPGNAGGTTSASAIRFMPIERMNAVLAISEQPVWIERARDWIQRLDRGGGGEDQRQLYVYHLKNARAAEIAEVMGEIFDVRTVGDSSGRAGGGELAPGLAAGTLSGTTGGGATTNRAQAGAGTTGGSATTAGTGSGRATQQRGGNSTVNRSRGSGVAGAENGPRLIADERNDAMLILATAQEFRMIESTIKRLDVAPLQVMIEATIAEVTLNDALSFGVRWFFDASGSDDTQNISFSDVETGAVASTFPGFSYLFEGDSARVALNALNEITDVTIVSSPQLMVLDNQTARLQVGDQVPVPVQQSVSTIDPAAPIVNSIQFQDTGVILEVTPHVNASGLVVIDVRQEVSNVVATTSSGIDAPTIQQRQISSTVAVQTGETIALGGLIRDSSTTGQVGVPILMHIPLLGNLFKTTTLTNERTELLVLLTPKVVRDRDEARSVTQELRRRLRGLERIRQQFGLEEAPDEAAAEEIAKEEPPLP